MKKSIIILIVFSLLFVACKNPSDEKTNENKVEDTAATDEQKMTSPKMKIKKISTNKKMRKSRKMKKKK